MQPLISFVVVTHDRPIELVENRIIRSIAQQDYPRLELVLMGEECQHMGELVARLQKNFAGLQLRGTNVSRPQMVLSSPWSLAARCRNLGVSLAQGEFISCQDDDNELGSDFASSLLDLLLTTGAEAAWCHRKWVMPDGSPYPGTFFPWAEPGTVQERLIYEMWRSAGVLAPGSDIVRDQLLATFNSETFSTVDANEWLVRSYIHRQFPFREKYGFYDLMANAAYDDLWNIAIREAGVRTACSERVSLVYHLGGGSNASTIARWMSNQATEEKTVRSAGPV
jgi:hypothetical protein